MNLGRRIQSQGSEHCSRSCRSTAWQNSARRSELVGLLTNTPAELQILTRHREGFTNDPYLSGQLVIEAVTGMEDTGVTTCTKHFIANEQETNRNPLTNATTNVTAASSSVNIDDKTIHVSGIDMMKSASHREC